MKSIENWLEDYGVSHKNPTNKMIHWICVPLIMFSLIGLLWSIPVGFLTNISPWLNIASLFILFALFFYFRLSISLAIGFIFVGAVLLYGNSIIAGSSVGSQLWLISIIIFVVAWVGQFIGHKIEGAKPSFFKDLQFLLIGPIWLLSFIYKKVGIPI